jgi:hypothetical protein
MGLTASAKTWSDWTWTAEYLVNSGEGADAEDGHMIRLGTSAPVLGGGLTAKFDSVGSTFGEAKGLGAHPGRDTFSAEWRGSGERASGYLTYATEDPASGATRTKATGGLNMDLFSDLKLSASRTMTATGDRSRLHDTIGLDYAANRITTFGLDWLGEVGNGGATRLRFAVDDAAASIRASHTMPDGSGDAATDVASSIHVSDSLRVETAARAESGASSTDTKVWWDTGRSLGLAATYATAANSPYTEAKGVEMRWAPAGFFEMSGVGRRHKLLEGEEPLDTLAVDVKLSPIRALSLSGGYADHPEDKLGLPQDTAERRLGARLSAGPFWVGGTFKENQNLAGDDLRQDYRFEGGLQFAHSTSLRLSYGYESLFAAGLDETRYYGLQFQHTSGLWKLSLEGRMKDLYEDGRLMSDRREYEGRASIGIEF